MSVSIDVPDGCKAIIVTEQALEGYKDWRNVGGPLAYGDDYKVIEARVQPGDPEDPIVEIESRFSDVPAERVLRQLPDGAHYESSGPPRMEFR